MSVINWLQARFQPAGAVPQVAPAGIRMALFPHGISADGRILLDKEMPSFEAWRPSFGKSGPTPELRDLYRTILENDPLSREIVGKQHFHHDRDGSLNAWVTEIRDQLDKSVDGKVKLGVVMNLSIPRMFLDEMDVLEKILSTPLSRISGYISDNMNDSTIWANYDALVKASEDLAQRLWAVEHVSFGALIRSAIHEDHSIWNHSQFSQADLLSAARYLKAAGEASPLTPADGGLYETDVHGVPREKSIISWGSDKDANLDAAGFHLLSGILFICGGRRANMKEAEDAAEASTNLFIKSRCTALAALAGEIAAFAHARRSGAGRSANRYFDLATLCWIEAAKNYFHYDPPGTRIALFRGLTDASFMQQVPRNARGPSQPGRYHNAERPVPSNLIRELQNLLEADDARRAR